MSCSTNTIIIDTGNIFNFGILKPKILQHPYAEIIQGLEIVLGCKNSKWETIKLDQSEVEFKCLRFQEENSTQEHDRNKLKLSVKLFLFPEVINNQNECKQLVMEESIETICKLLTINQIDNLIISIQTNDVDETIGNLKPFWNVCENLVSVEKIRSLGTSDLNCQQLTELYNWASFVKPSSNQINLDACCDIPADLSAFAKENSIQLLTHNDSTSDFLPIECLNELFEKKDHLGLISKRKTKDDLKRKWIARYTFVVPTQGVVLSKGYLISLLV